MERAGLAYGTTFRGGPNGVSDWFTKDKLARTIKVPLEDAHMTVVPLGDGRNRVEVVFPFEFTYDTFPKEISLSQRRLKR